MGNVCCFIGHRKINITDELRQRVKEVVEDLIVNFNVDAFLFGSRSDFDYLCHLIVSELKEKYPHIKRVAYTCRSETCVLESEREEWEKIYSNIHKRKVKLLCVEEEFEHQTKYTSAKASYVERNQAMIENSDFCVFYFDENYKPPIRKHSKKELVYYQPTSGTKLAFKFATSKNKKVINLNEKRNSLS